MRKFILLSSSLWLFLVTAQAQVASSSGVSFTNQVLLISSKLQAPVASSGVQQYLHDGKEWVLNATTQYNYSADKKLLSKVYIPTPYKKTGYQLETFKTDYLAYNKFGKPVLMKRYALRNGLYIEVEKKTKVYDDKGNIAEIHTLYKGEKQYVYANYDGSFKFKYTYNSKGQPTTIESEYYYLGYNSDWYKGSKRIFTYNTDGTINSIERLPFSFLTNNYIQAGAVKYTNIKWDDFAFETFFEAGQNLDAVEDVKSYDVEEWDEKSQKYKATKSAVLKEAITDGEEVKDMVLNDQSLQQTTTRNPAGYIQSVNFENRKESTHPLAAIRYQYVLNDGNVSEQISEVWNASVQKYEPQERLVYTNEAAGSAIPLVDAAVLTAYPNPFIEATQIQYTLASTENVLIEVYNVLGTKISTLLATEQSMGKHTIQLKDIPAGAYVVQMHVGDKVYSHRILKQRE